MDANGQPFPFVGDAAWSLIAQLTREDALTYMQDRKNRGFNTLLVNLVEHKFASRTPANIYGDAPFTTPEDFSTPNDAYFAHADYVLSKAAELNLLVLLAPAYLGYNGGDEGWYQAMLANGTTKLRNYGKYVGARYAGLKNILWTEGCDYNPPNKTLTDAVAQGIVESDPSALHTAHCARGTSALDFWSGYSWLGVNNIYTSNSVYPSGVSAYNRADQTPFFNIEAVYENASAGSAGFDQVLLRTQAYESIACGGTGHVFGNNPIWHFDSVPNSAYPRPYDWKTALGAAGSVSMTRFAAFLNATQWWKFAPSTSLITVGADTNGNARSGLAADGSVAMIYMPGSRQITVDLSRFAGPQVRITWYDPGSGATADGGSFAASGTQVLANRGANSTGYSDWVLYFESI
ncbi:MAG: DUF4038 domain-containing protein [Hyphomonadaceae bacterium]